MQLAPKEKAEELICKFKYNTRAWNETNGWQDCSYNARQCALIAVDEILKSGKDVDEFSDRYWLKVRNELLNN